MRTVFWLAAVPAALAVLVLVMGVRESPRLQGDAKRGDARHRNDAGRGEITQGGAPGLQATAAPSPAGQPSAVLEPPASLPRRFWLFVAAILLFTLGNSTDAFLLLRASQLGVATALVPVLWAMLHVVKSASSTPGGALSDRVGRRPLIIAGWALYALVYLGFGLASASWHAWALFAVYGVFFGLTEGAEKALVADLVPASRRGAAFGWYNLAVGLAALPASVLFGALWDRYGAPTAFATGASLAIAASLVVAVAVPRRVA